MSSNQCIIHSSFEDETKDTCLATVEIVCEEGIVIPDTPDVLEECRSLKTVVRKVNAETSFLDDRVAEMRGAQTPQPQADDADLPSVGSKWHAPGACKPCGFFGRVMGCQFGTECIYCHMCTLEDKKQRKKSRKMLMRQQSIESQE